MKYTNTVEAEIFLQDLILLFLFMTNFLTQVSINTELMHNSFKGL